MGGQGNGSGTSPCVPRHWWWQCRRGGESRRALQGPQRTCHVKPFPNRSNPANNCWGGWISIIKRKPGLINILNLLKVTQVKRRRLALSASYSKTCELSFKSE